LVSRSSTTVSVLGPVDIFLTPLCTECLDRYITIMTPVVANRSPSAVIDELHFKCLLSAGRQGKVLYEEKLKHQYPSLSVENVKSPPPSASSPAPNSTKKASFFDQFSENTLWFHRFGSISMDHVVTPVPSNETQSTQAGPRSRPDVPALVNTTEDASSNMTHPPPLSGIHSHHHDRKHHLAEENNLVGLLSLGRVNIGFMQIYAVEDVVTVDSLSLGLNDLTCVSLLTLAVDAVKIQMLNNKRILHVGMESRKLEASSTAPLSNATPFSPEVLTRSLLTAEERRLSEVLEENDEDNSTAASPLLSSSHRSNSNSIRRESQTALTAASNSKPNLTEGDVESGPTIVELKPQPIPKVVSATEVRHTERLVCNFSISRIHSQLRRLTRESSFTPDVLLTAIPFSASRVFFAFDADQSAISRQAGTTRKSPPAVGGLYTGVHGPTPANSTSQLHQPPQPSNIPLCTSESALPGHSAGWIMFESGMEELTLLFVQRKGFGDSLEEKSDNMTTDQPNKRKPKAIDVPSPTLLTEETPKEETYDDAEGIKNAFLMNLHVKTVWLNFPAPKHLPSKRRMELIRSDWNFLSTMTPTVNAWIGPCNRLAGHSKNLITLADRRTLSVLACLMMEAVNGDKLLPDFRFSSLEDEIFNTISTLRTPDSRRLRYDPSCQIFTTLRRYLQVLRKRDGPAALNSKLNDWLRESVLPEKMTLLRGLFLILREWRVAVDVLVLPQVAPAISRKFTTLLSRRKEDSGRKALHTTTTANMALNEPLERRPSGLTLRMFELMTQNTADSRTVNAAGGGRSNGNINAVEEIDENEESDLDDESLINDPRLRKENTILYRFLQDAQHVIRQSESGGNILDTSDDSAVLRGSGPPAASSEPKREFRPKPSAVAENTADSQQQRQRSRSPSLTPENMNQINHLKGQFRFVDDAQRLFRPLLEAIGVNIKGVRRSTLMKKFGGLFAAEGMLDCFQIEICDSLENPLQKVATSPTNSCVITSARRLKSFNTSKFNASGHSTSGSTQRALMCHRFSTKITLMDVVLFGKQECETSRLGDIELRSTTTKIIADLHVDSISQHSNMPLFRLTHQFVTMFYCAQDAQKSADRRRNLILAKPAPFDAKGSVTDTVETGSTLKSRPDYTRLSGHSQDSTIDSTVYQPFSNLEANVGGSASIPIPRREGTVSQNVRSSSFESPREASYGKTPGSSTETQGGGLFSGLPSASVPNAATFTTIPQNTPVMPECWRRMLRYIDLYSTVPETKNVVKKVRLVCVTR
uniref:FSA_C domain-containing protein n=1 Tax=Hymenolepis diminuta TaxID=6216 RepID=A0A0R3SHY0_HYMDI